MIPTLTSTTTAITATLPDGSRLESASGAEAQAAFTAVWDLWCRMAPVAAARREGVALSQDADGYLLEAVYAPSGERMAAHVSWTGEVSYLSEQSAPAF